MSSDCAAPLEVSSGLRKKSLHGWNRPLGLRENRKKETADLSTALRSGPTARRGRRDDKFVAKLDPILHGKKVITYQQICHLACPGVPWDRSAA
jgi:hypothetical protein